MKYICLGCIEESTMDGWTDAERMAFMDQCFAYDDELRRNGNFIGGEALQSSRNAVTVRTKNGKAVVTDGPFAETKEMLGGIMILEAADLNHAIQLMSRHPSIYMGGSFEIRPAADLSDMVAQSEVRRAAARKGGESV
jgi:hypothetical protein